MKTKLLFILLVGLIGTAVPARATFYPNNCAYWGRPPVVTQTNTPSKNGSNPSSSIQVLAQAYDGAVQPPQLYCQRTVAITALGGILPDGFNCPPSTSYTLFVPDDTNPATPLAVTAIGVNTLASEGARGTNQTCDDDPPATQTKTCNTFKCGKNSCPVVLDLSGQGFFFTSVANGVKFDFAGNGDPIQVAWTAPGADNGFLALPGLDGVIHNSIQLFGNFTPQPPSAHRNGFAALAVYDDPTNGGNGDGVIDSKDAVFNSLRIWIDANHDGICQPDELYTLPSLGINSISLSYYPDPITDQFGNVLKYWAPVNPDNPNNGSTVGTKAVDVFFV